MPAAVKTFKIQVSVSHEMLDKIDFYSQAMGVSRSALCAMFIGQGIMNYDNVKSLIGGLDVNAIIAFLASASSGELGKFDFD